MGLLPPHSSEAEAPEQSEQQEVQVAQPRPGVHRWRATLLCVLCTFWRRISQAGSQLGLGRPALIRRWVLRGTIPFQPHWFLWTVWLNKLCLCALQVQCSSLTTLWLCACWAARLPPPWPAHLPPCSPSNNQEVEPTLRPAPGRGSHRCSRSSTKPCRTATTELGREPLTLLSSLRPPSPVPRVTENPCPWRGGPANTRPTQC